jgi:bifunctional ADP-heptose synthase (sugar kinase/adenylyltransferase)
MKILVIGEECLDVFEYGTCTRLNPEAPTPVFVSTQKISSGGMAANVQANIEDLLPGAQVKFLKQTSGSIIKHRYVDSASNYILLRVDHDGPAEPLVLDQRLIDRIYEADVVVVSDYCKGFLDIDTLREIAKIARVSFIDTKKPLGYWAKDFSWIKINSKEWANPNHDPAFLKDFGFKIIVTLGDRGARIGKVEIEPEKRVEVKDVSGAGDSFLAGLAACYAKTRDLDAAIRYANHCAGIAVSKRGVVSDILSSI